MSILLNMLLHGSQALEGQHCLTATCTHSHLQLKRSAPRSELNAMDVALHAAGKELLAARLAQQRGAGRLEAIPELPQADLDAIAREPNRPGAPRSARPHLALCSVTAGLRLVLSSCQTRKQPAVLVGICAAFAAVTLAGGAHMVQYRLCAVQPCVKGVQALQAVAD